jgi:hypothetical protein
MYNGNKFDSQQPPPKQYQSNQHPNNQVEFVEDESLSIESETTLNTLFNESIGSFGSIDLLRTAIYEHNSNNNKHKNNDTLLESSYLRKRLLQNEDKNVNCVYSSRIYASHLVIIIIIMLICACSLLLANHMSNGDKHGELYNFSIILLVASLATCCCLMSCVQYKNRSHSVNNK